MSRNRRFYIAKAGLYNQRLTGAYPGDRFKMNKATVTLADGNTAEVELSAITLPEGHSIFDGQSAPNGYVKQEVFDAKVQNFKSQVKRSLQSDDEFKLEVLKAAGVPLGEDGKYVAPKGKDVDMEAIRRQFEAEMVSPLKQQLEGYQAKTSKLLEARKRYEILQAAQKLGVKEEFLKPLHEGGPSAWENMVSGMYGYHEESDTLALKQGDNFAYNPNGTQDNPYLTISAHGESLKKQDNFRSFFKVEGQQGSGFKNNGAPRTPGVVSRDDMASGKLTPEQVEQIATGKLRVQ